MPKTTEERRLRSLRNYYENRERKIKYQREYDKENKIRKKEYEQRTRRNKRQYFIEGIRHYSQKHHKPILIEKYGGCQFCNSKNELEVHHKKYTKKIEDCLLLCLGCHKNIHKKFVIK